jgi:hypothetical protein
MDKRGTRIDTGRISGQIIIDELTRNMELGQLEMGYSVLLPCIFSVYLHPDDLARLAPVADIVKEDACRALSARLAEWNRAPSRFRRPSRPKKAFRIARKDWWIEFFADSEGAVPPGDLEIHSALNDSPQPEFRGARTTLIGRKPSVTAARVAEDRRITRKHADQIYAEIRYEDDSGPQTFYVTQDEISVGRGGDDLWVDLTLYTGEEVSREHLRLRRDPSSGVFEIVDSSRNGTWLDGRRLPRGEPRSVPERAQISVAETITLSFEARR